MGLISALFRLLLASCVPASAAAPPPFPPCVVPGVGAPVGGDAGGAGAPVHHPWAVAFEGTPPRAHRPAAPGRAPVGPRPTWLGSWLWWILSELFRSPGEQQTELVQRHYAAAPFYRIDVRLPRDFPLDTTGAGLDELEAIGRRLAATLDWPAILDGTATA